MIAANGSEFRNIVKGVNFMTPRVSGYYISGDYLIEISRGKGFDGSAIYGVTVANSVTKEHEHELSKCVGSLYEAKKYAKSLGRA